ncbi:MAG: transposase [Lachnospiraceae bacterium]|nr:transposase [Lachnospiraceae bacterium]
MKQWNQIQEFSTTNMKQRYVEQLIHDTKKNTAIYDFDRQFYKFPSYLRRSAITEAIGKVSSYQNNLKNWNTADWSERGDKPGYPKAGFIYPCMYRGNMYQKSGTYTARIKVWTNNTWDWLDITLRKSDVDYINRYCNNRKACAPTLMKRGKQWYLDFPFEEQVKLLDTDVWKQRVLAVDLGLNNSCVCSVMQADGTILGRRFCKLPREYDSLQHKLDHIKRAQKQGSRRVPNLWRLANHVNDDIAIKTARFIMDTAALYNVNVIVFEHLDLKGKKRGSRRQKLHLWRANGIQAMVTDKAHRLGMRISHVNAWNTSRLAFDGSGRVLRGSESTKIEEDNYSLCEFTTGKVYHCDLNATYNIGARYFIRELLKTVPVTEQQYIAAKVPECTKRSTCTLSTLISLNSVLCT